MFVRNMICSLLSHSPWFYILFIKFCSQSATGVQDLGVLYYKAFKDAHGSILLLTLNDVKVNSFDISYHLYSLHTQGMNLPLSLN